MVIVLFIAGLASLIVGAEALVRGASRLAAAFGLSPLVIGLTVVAFGTSSPELAVSLKAALSDQASIGVGNVVGSNIFNILLILGLSALIVPLVAAQQLVRFDVPLMIAISLMVLVYSLDGIFSRAEGLSMVAGLIIYLSFLMIQCRRENVGAQEADTKEHRLEGNKKYSWVRDIVFVLSGFALLVLVYYFGASDGSEFMKMP